MKARFLALAALVLGLASCQTEPEGLDVNVGGAVDTYVTVSLPETTRANSHLGAFENVVADANYTIRYIFQVFYGEDESKAARQVIYTDNDEVSFPVRLVPNRHYNFVVWADVVPTPANFDDGTIYDLTIDQAVATDYHYNTRDLKDIKIIDVENDHEWEEMDETRDAFTGQYYTAEDGDGSPYTGAKNISFTLTRPFAKLRVITTDMEQLNDLEIEPKTAKVVYTTDLFASFNAFAGAVNESAMLRKTHDIFEIKSYDDNATDESMVLFTDYLFAADQDEVVNFTLTVYDQDDVVIGKTINFNTPIPARRNYLTTISGNILTDGNKITVDVTEGFANADNSTNAPYYQQTISSAAEFLAAIELLENGGDYKFIVITPIVIDHSTISTLAATRAATSAPGKVTINLNGFTVTFVNNTDEPILTLPAGSEFTLVNDSNEGGIILTGEGTGAAIENNGSLNIEGVALQSESDGAVIENNNMANIEDSTLNDGALVNNENGQANIEGSTLNEGSFENNGQADFTNSTLNEGSVENNGQANVNGGNVDDNAVENGEGAVVGSQSAEDLQRAINNAKVGEPNVFALTSDVVGNITVSQSENINITIDGKGYKFDGTIYVDGNSRNPAAETLLIQNVNFESATDKDFIWADDASVANRYPHNITIKDCTFTGLEGAEVVAIRCRQTYNLTIKDCQATNVHSFGQITSTIGIAISDVTVNGQSGFNFLTSAANASITNCGITATKEDGYGIRVGATGANTMNVKNCTIAAFRPIVLRSTEAAFTLELDGNTLTPTDKYHIYVESGVLPTLNGADDLIVYPRDVVSSWDEFTAAVDKGKTFFLLANDIEYTSSYSLQKDVTIDLNGKSLVINDPSKMLNIGDAKNNTKPNVTIKNGNLNCMVYALSGNLTIQNVAFGGTIAYVQASQGVISTKHASLLMEDCNMKNVKKSGSTKPRSICTEGRSGGYLIFRNCDFKNSNLDRPYINPLNGNAVLEITDCALYSGASNIDIGASYVWSNLNLTGCSGGFTFTISRASTSLTEEELTIYRAIKQNNSGSKRFIFSDGEKNNL